MKKLDVLVIVIVLIIGVSLFAFYYDKFNVNTNNATVVIKYKNMILDELDYDESLNYTYSIYGEDLNRLIVLVEQDGVEMERRTYSVELSKNIRNKITLSYEKIYMNLEINDHDHSLDWPNCPDKICTRIYMDASHTLPIVCINGVYVEFVTEKGEIPIPVS